MRFLSLIFFFILTLSANANLYIKVGLFQFDNPQSVIVTPAMGTYQVICDDKFNFTLSIGEVIKFTIINDSLVKIQSLQGDKGAFKTIKLIGNNLNNKFKIKSVEPSMNTQTLNGDLNVEVLFDYLQFVNTIDIEDYVPKVVEAEAGISPELEYLKLQAIICRTYAISNLRRHEFEGYQLCDKVHCQVYKSGGQVNSKVLEASKSTEGQVIIDETKNTINATFHSNCGGHTLNSEDVWTNSANYLKAVEDPYCKSANHSNWTKEIPKKDLLSYYSTLFGFEITEKDVLKNDFNTLADTRKPDYFYKNKSVSIKEIRYKFNLNSIKFKIAKSPNNSSLFELTGQGFGHRVGMCQEGAMQMAEQNIDYKTILSHYFKGVEIIYFKDLGFLH